MGEWGVLEMQWDAKAMDDEMSADDKILSVNRTRI